MKLSIETYIMRKRFNDVKALEMIKKAGFDCYDYSMYGLADAEKDMLGDDYRERAEALRHASDEIGIECNQAHAPFEIGAENTFDVSDKSYLRLVRSLEAASILGAENIIVHAIKDKLPQGTDFYELNRKFYLSLEPYCEKFNICVSVENLFNCRGDKTLPVLSDPTEHMDFVKSLNSPWFNICVDVGHSAITGYKPEEVIAAMNGDILKALHIHDNRSIWDQHTMPYAGGIKWQAVLEAIKKIRYQGDFTFELIGYLSKLPDELLQDALDFAAIIGRNMLSEF